MIYALELLFDNQSTNFIMSLRSLLREQGLRKTCRQDPEYPHLSLYVWESLDPKTITPTLAQIAGSPDQGVPGLKDIILDTMDSFTGPLFVLYMAPRHNLKLFRLHDQWLNALMDTVSSILPTYLPSAWVPHVTLAENLTSKNLGRAENIASWDGPVIASLSDLILVEVQPPARRIVEYYPLVCLHPEQHVWFRFNEALVTKQYFEAHEILEELWRQSHDSKVQTAIWIAAVFTHWSRKRQEGALKIVNKILQSPSRYPDSLRTTLQAWRLLLYSRRPMPDIRAGVSPL